MISVPAILKNEESLYEGDLAYYFRVVIKYATNLKNPYHNLRHMLHITWLCYDACVYYRHRLSPRQMRVLLIAALFHDFNHSGKVGNDHREIKRAVVGLKKHIQRQDLFLLEEIVELIKITEFPHQKTPLSLSLSSQILRDADLSQGLSDAWIQQSAIGLGMESSIDPIEMLKEQISFYEKLSFKTVWAKKKFTAKKIKDRQQEIREYLSLLN